MNFKKNILEGNLGGNLADSHICSHVTDWWGGLVLTTNLEHLMEKGIRSSGATPFPNVRRSHEQGQTSGAASYDYDKPLARRILLPKSFDAIPRVSTLACRNNPASNRNTLVLIFKALHSLAIYLSFIPLLLCSCLCPLYLLFCHHLLLKCCLFPQETAVSLWLPMPETAAMYSVCVCILSLLCLPSNPTTSPTFSMRIWAHCNPPKCGTELYTSPTSLLQMPPPPHCFPVSTFRM